MWAINPSQLPCGTSNGLLSTPRQPPCRYSTGAAGKGTHSGDQILPMNGLPGPHPPAICRHQAPPWPSDAPGRPEAWCPARTCNRGRHGSPVDLAKPNIKPPTTGLAPAPPRPCRCREGGARPGRAPTGGGPAASAGAETPLHPKSVCPGCLHVRWPLGPLHWGRGHVGKTGLRVVGAAPPSRPTPDPPGDAGRHAALPRYAALSLRVASRRSAAVCVSPVLLAAPPRARSPTAPPAPKPNWPCMSVPSPPLPQPPPPATVPPP